MTRIRNNIRKIISSDFNRNFFKLFRGTLIGQMLPVIVAPIISRLYTPEDIGKFALYSSILSICTGFVSLKLNEALVLPANKREAIRLLGISLKIAFRFSVLSLVILSIYKLLALFQVVNDFPFWWFLLSVHIFILGLSQVGDYALSRNKQFAALGLSRIYNGMSYSLLQIVLFKLQGVGLVLSLFISRAFNSIFFYRKMKEMKMITRQTIYTAVDRFSYTDKILIKKYKNFLTYGAPTSVLNIGSNQLPVFLLQVFYSSQITGIYSWANRIIQMPMGLITASVTQVFYQGVASRIADKKPVYAMVKATNKKLFLIGIIPYSLVFLFAPQLFSIVFGSQWTAAGEYTRCLIPWLFMAFLNSPITGIIPAFGKQRMQFLNEIILFFLRFISLILGYYIWNDSYMSVLLFGIVGFLYNLYLFIYLLKTVKRNESI